MSMAAKTAYQGEMENTAVACGRGLAISYKKAYELANFVRGQKVSRAKTMLNGIINMTVAVPMRRYNRDTAHRKSTGPGKYPVRTAKSVLTIIESAEQNALSKGLNSSQLVIKHISACKASTPWHYGRHRRRKMKRANVDVVVAEEKDKEKK